MGLLLQTRQAVRLQPELQVSVGAVLECRVDTCPVLCIYPAIYCLPSYPWCYVGEAGFDQWRPCDEDRAALGNR